MASASCDAVGAVVLRNVKRVLRFEREWGDNVSTAKVTMR